MPNRDFDVIIVGGGVTGTSLMYVLSRYTNIGRIALIEKNSGVGQVNSHPLNNAQTSHDGGTETNYTLEHAREVQHAAHLLRAYVRSRTVDGLYQITNRMVIGVGVAEVAKLRKRYEDFKTFYPDLRLVEREELGRLEPKVMEGRHSNQSICALVSKEGYAINYQVLSDCFMKDAYRANETVEMFFGTGVTRVRRQAHPLDGFILYTDKGVFTTKVVVFAAGAYSLLFAQQLSYGMDYGILPVAGSFYSSKKLVNGKVYRMQVEGRPFAEVHCDPDVLDQEVSRFGPTTKPLPLMERHHYKTFWDFIKLPIVSFRGLSALMKIIIQNHLLAYILRNVVYDLPIVGKLFFLREARVIIPTITRHDLYLRKGAGGIRPQIVNLKTGKLEMGDKRILGEARDTCIFNTTPSPGASVCLANAIRDAEHITRYYFYPTGRFDKKRLEADLEVSVE